MRAGRYQPTTSTQVIQGKNKLTHYQLADGDEGLLPAAHAAHFFLSSRRNCKDNIDLIAAITAVLTLTLVLCPCADIGL